MTLNKKAQDWLERYIRESSIFLPLNNRDELKKEMKAYLLDTLEDRYPESEISEEQMQEFLKEQGAPMNQGRRFGENRSLLSPSIMPLFTLIVMIVMAVLSAVTIFTSFFKADMTFWKVFQGWFSMVTSAFGIMVLVFAFMDRMIPQWKWEKEINEDWNPKELSPLPKDENSSMGDAIATWFFTAIFTVLFLAYRDKIGIWYRVDQGWSMVPIFAQGFYQLIPFFIGAMLWDSLTHVFLVVQKGWTKVSRSMDLLKSIYDLGISFFLLKAGWTFLFMENVVWPMDIKGWQNFAQWGYKLYTPLLILAVIGTVVEAIKKSTYLLKE